MGKVKREGASVTVEMTQGEFQSVIDRLGHDPRLSDYSVVAAHVAKKIDMENAVRVTTEVNCMVIFNYVPNIEAYLREHFRD